MWAADEGGGGQAQWKVGGTNVLGLCSLSPVFTWEERKEAAPGCQTTSTTGDGGWSFDDTTETPM